MRLVADRRLSSRSSAYNTPHSVTLTPRSLQVLPLLCQFYCLIDKQTTCMCHTSYHGPLNQSNPYRHKAILDYLHNAGFSKSFEQLKEDTKLVRPV